MGEDASCRSEEYSAVSDMAEKQTPCRWYTERSVADRIVLSTDWEGAPVDLHRLNLRRM